MSNNNGARKSVLDDYNAVIPRRPHEALHCVRTPYIHLSVLSKTLS